MKVRDLKVVISHSPTKKEEEHEESSKKEEAEEEKDKTKEDQEATTKNGDAATNNPPTENESLYTLTAKPQKISGSYGWSASVQRAKIKTEIDGEEVELPATITFNITVKK